MSTTTDPTFADISLKSMPADQHAVTIPEDGAAMSGEVATENAQSQPQEYGIHHMYKHQSHQFYSSGVRFLTELYLSLENGTLMLLQLESTA